MLKDPKVAQLPNLLNILLCTHWMSELLASWYAVLKFVTICFWDSYREVKIVMGQAIFPAYQIRLKPLKVTRNHVMLELSSLLICLPIVVCWVNSAQPWNIEVRHFLKFWSWIQVYHKVTSSQWVRRVQRRNFGSWISLDFVVLVNSLGFK